jgi:hypothetical protein
MDLGGFAVRVVIVLVHIARDIAWPSLPRDPVRGISRTEKTIILDRADGASTTAR